jgi:hypothetical protein
MMQVTGGFQVGMKNSSTDIGQKISHPPSIPSHNTVFGYEENPKG